MSYQFESRIRYSECDSKADLKYIALLDYFQDASVFQSESLNVGVDFQAKKKCFWVLNSWQICIARMPHLCEEVVIETRPYEIKGFFGLRNFIMTTKSGEKLAWANSIWTFFDLEKNMPTKVTDDVKVYELDSPLEMDYCERKLAVPAEREALEAIPVTAQLIDTNGHVNNGRYVELALGLLPENFLIKEIRAEYKMQAHMGDTLYPSIGREGDKVTVVMADQEGKAYATVQCISA